MVSRKGPGVFLQGLAAYGRGGELVAAGELPAEVVRDAFLFSGEPRAKLEGWGRPYTEDIELGNALHRRNTAG